MRRILVIAAAGLLLTLVLPHGAWAFGKKDVVRMTQEGIPDTLIITKIMHSGAIFDLKTKDIELLRDEGVSDRVILAMLRTESHQPGYYFGAWGWPYYYEPYYSPWGFGFGFDDFPRFHSFGDFDRRGFEGHEGFHRR